MKDGVPWPKIYGGGVEVETGEVFTAQVLFLTIVDCRHSTSFTLTPSNKIILNMQFTYHGPDADIRQLRLHSSGATLVNVYDPYSGKVVVSVIHLGTAFHSFDGFPIGIVIIVSRYQPQVRPFSYRPMVEAHLWLQKNDEFILRYC